MKKITRRWLINSFGVIAVSILVLEAAFFVGISHYFYASMRQQLNTCAVDAVTAMQQQTEAFGEAEASAQIQSYVERFSQPDAQMHLIVVNAGGTAEFASDGLAPDDCTGLLRYSAASASAERSAYCVGRMDGQRVIAYTLLLPDTMQTPDRVAVCVVMGRRLADRQVLHLTAIVLGLGLVVLAMVLLSSFYFLRSIVNPLSEVGKTAQHIAQGDFSTRLAKENDDEIGDLCDIINQMAEKLSTTERMKNDFISGVSHELRTPLTAIQGWAETLQADDGTDRDLQRKGMGVILRETGRLSQMVEELLDVSRMQSGRLKLVKRRIDAIAELSEAVLMYTERARREGISLYWEDPEQVAPIYGDKDKLRQVFVNILDNAVKYSNRGGAVFVRAAIKSDRLVIQVEDHGIGIRKENLSHIKQKFYKADFTRRGSGIGLALADEIVTCHGGTLHIASQYGKQTVVTIVLPLFHGQTVHEKNRKKNADL